MSSPETGFSDRASYILRQGEIHLVVTSGSGSSSPVSVWVARHGHGVRDVALGVTNVAAVLGRAVAHGAELAGDLTEHRDEEGRGSMQRGAIGVYGDVIHTLIERCDYDGPFLPGYRAPLAGFGSMGPMPGLTSIDPLDACVERGDLARWVDFDETVLGFKSIIYYHGDFLMNKAVADRSGHIKFPLTQPTEGSPFSHVDEFLRAGCLSCARQRPTTMS